MNSDNKAFFPRQQFDEYILQVLIEQFSWKK